MPQCWRIAMKTLAPNYGLITFIPNSYAAEYAALIGMATEIDCLLVKLMNF